MENFEVVNQLPSEPPSRIWMEITHSLHKHGGSGWEFSTCLWSPSRDKLDRDWYKAMREVQESDLVIHSNDAVIVGFSFAKSSYHEVNEEPPSPGSWANMAPYYRIDLEGYSQFTIQLSRAELARKYRDRISKDIEKGRVDRYPFIQTKHGDIRTVQGSYLTRCTTTLYQIIREAIGEKIATSIGKSKKIIKMETSQERVSFSWLPFFEEMLNIICGQYDKNSLCAVFHDIFGKGGGTTDQFPDGTSGPLKEIDPLTFIAFFNRNNTLKKRVAFCKDAKRKFEMSANVPSDFEGIPVLNPENTWFFPYSKNRSPDDIANLWSFSRKLNKGEIGAELFEKVLKIRNVGTPKLTVLMFICKPADFISLDGTNIDYFKHNGLEVSVRNYLEYEAVLSRIKEHFSSNTFYEISYDAYLRRSDKSKPGKKDTGNIKYWGIPKEQYTINDFINETGFSRQNIESWQQQLIRKKQVIFYGPPGTGKTYVAKKLARLMISGSSGFYDSVQFHPAYAYEDFIQGFRPKTENGMLTYKIEPGTFLLFSKKAISQAPSPCILIIDEINRAKLSSVFGELMYCLEYREQEVKLAANGALFHIPDNAYLIGTMNTADRSIALVDHALRRRFCFLRLNPEYEILKAYLEKHNYPAEALVDVLKDVNKIIDNPNYEIGISYFMNNSKDLKSVLPLIWKGEIEPYLEELFYDQLKKVADFRWDRLAEYKLSKWVT